MASTIASRSEKIRARLNHPVIDCDGHTIELSPVLHDYIRQVGGKSMVDRRVGLQSGGLLGSEADDPTVAWAFNRKVNPFGARLRAILSSDIGHWDVTDMREVIAEAYELVEKGVLTEADFRDFMFTNAVSLYTGMNRDFFKGTCCEAQVEKYLTGC